MDEVPAAQLKTILHSKRANLYYLEHCRVLVNGGRVGYVTDQGKQSLYWNIPIANTTTLLLGTGTSITQAAVHELAKAGVMLGFCGGGGTPLFADMEQTLEVAWMPPQSEYRPTQYLQHWVRFWFDDGLRLAAAKAFQSARRERLRQHWAGSRALKELGFIADLPALDAVLAPAAVAMQSAADHGLPLFTAAQAAQKTAASGSWHPGSFTAAQAAQKGWRARPGSKAWTWKRPVHRWCSSCVAALRSAKSSPAATHPSRRARHEPRRQPAPPARRRAAGNRALAWSPPPRLPGTAR